MGNLFGVRRRVQVVSVTPQDRVILQLKLQRDKIKSYQNGIESKLDSERQLAISLLAKNMKERALVILRKKKFMEDVLKRTDGQLATLEQLVQDIEFSQIEISVVEGLKAGTEALKQLNSVISIENVQQIMEDNEEAAEKQREISRLLSGTERYDEEELLNDLEGYLVPVTEQPKNIEQEEKEKGQEPEAMKERPGREAAPVEELPTVPAGVKLSATSIEETPATQLEDLPATPMDEISADSEAPKEADSGKQEQKRSKSRQAMLAE